jgi:predicted nucleotide-binding protein
MNAGPNAGVISRDISERELAEKRRQRLSAIIGQLRQAIRILELPMAEPMASSTAAVQPTPPTAPHSEKTIFLVHGRDDATKYAVRSFIEQHVVDHKVTILHEQANEGHTIIEKFEKHAAAAFAVVLLTPDDVGGLAGEPLEKQRARARQNVIFELGYFIARLGRARVCALCTEGVEAPSDFAGVVYVPLDAHDGWHLKLLRELKSAGFAVRL